MSEDPYHAVQQEVQTSLQTASTLRSSYLRIRSTAREDSEELVWAKNEVSCLEVFTGWEERGGEEETDSIHTDLFSCCS